MDAVRNDGIHRGCHASSPDAHNKKPAMSSDTRALKHLGTSLSNHLVPGAGIEPARLAARDFESRASTYSAIPATQASDYYRFHSREQALC